MPQTESPCDPARSSCEGEAMSARKWSSDPAVNPHSRCEREAKVAHETLRGAEAVINELFVRHGKPFMHDERPGFGNPGDSFYCTECRRTWPCEVFQTVARYGQLEPYASGMFKPLRLEIVETGGVR